MVSGGFKWFQVVPRFTEYDRLCFRKGCEMRGIFDINSFISRTKLNLLRNFLLKIKEKDSSFLENTRSSL